MRLTVVPLVLAVAALAATASPAAASYHSCSLGSWANKGSWYVTSMAVQHVTCGKGKRVVLAFQRCRHAHGKKGHCRHRVLHFRCRETRGYGHGQFTGKVVCRRGHKRVRHTYTQFT